MQLSKVYVIIVIAAMIAASCIVVVSPSTSADPGDADIVCIGDSITYGYHLDATQSYPAQLSRALGDDTIVVNAGISGQRSYQMSARFASDVLAYSPNKILVLGGTNDINNLDTVPLAATKSNLSAMVSAGVGSGATVYLGTVPPSTAIAENATKQAALIELNEWIRDQAAANVVVVDLWNVLKDPGNSSILYPPWTIDVNHPNEPGYRAVADAFLTAMGYPGLSMSIVKIWAASGSGTASVDANWIKGDKSGVTGKPTNGDIIYFTKYSTYNCTWDLAISLQGRIQGDGYTGTVTNSGIAYSYYYSLLDGGTYTGSPSGQETALGSWIRGRCSLTNDQLNLVAGEGASIDSRGTLTRIYGLSVIGHAELRGTQPIRSASGGLTIAPGGVLTIASGAMYEQPVTVQFVNQGQIVGPGTVHLTATSADTSRALGRISCALWIEALSSASANRVLTMSGDISGAADFTVSSSSSIYSMALNLNGRNITAGSISIGVRGAIMGGNGTISTSSWDSYNGTWAPEQSTVVISNGGHINLKSGQQFNLLYLQSPASSIESNDQSALNWTISSTGTISLTFTGLAPGKGYVISIDGEQQENALKADPNGSISFAYESSGSHVLSIGLSDFQVQMDSINELNSALIGVMMLVMIIGIVASMQGSRRRQ